MASHEFSQTGKPTENASGQSFNARIRADCSKTHIFESLKDVKKC